MKLIDLLKELSKGKKHLKMSIGLINGDNIRTLNFDGKQLAENESDEIYEIGEITETFTASLIAKAVYDDQVSLDSPISKYITELDSIYYQPTIEQLLTHTAGYENTPDRNMPADKVVEYAKNVRLTQVRYDYSYSNIGYAILGVIIERVIGYSYDVVMQNYIKNALGLAHTYVDNPDNGEKVLCGYGPNNEKVENWIWGDSGLKAAGAIYSSLDDMVQYVYKYINMRNSHLDMTHKGVYANNLNEQYSLGLAWKKSGNITWHKGQTGGFQSYIGFREDKKQGVVLLENYAGESDVKIEDIGKKILIDRVII